MTTCMTKSTTRATIIARAAAAATAAATTALALGIATPALAGSDVLIRQSAPFDACVAVQDAMMRNLGVEPEVLLVEMDTGAMLKRKYASAAADLVLVCNRVTDVLEVRRVTPGTVTGARGPDLAPDMAPRAAPRGRTVML